MIRPGAASWHDGEDQVGATVNQEAGLGKATIGEVLQVFAALGPSANEVVTDVMGLEAAAVDGGQWDAAAEESGRSGGGEGLV